MIEALIYIVVAWGILGLSTAIVTAAYAFNWFEDEDTMAALMPNRQIGWPFRLSLIATLPADLAATLWFGEFEWGKVAGHLRMLFVTGKAGDGYGTSALEAAKREASEVA